MVLGIRLPNDAEIIEVKDNFVYIKFDEKKPRRDLWKALFYSYLTDGETVQEFNDNNTLDCVRLMITHRNTIKAERSKLR